MVIVNGRFLGARPTGVQRVARSLLGAVNGALDADARQGWRLMRPSGAPPADGIDFTQRELGGGKGQLWEQLDLPRHAGGELLLNLCNTAPVFYRNNVVMIHDAQAFSYPQSYSRAFRSWYRFLLPRLGRTARRILTVSEFSKSQLVRYRIADPDKIDVIHNGADHFREIPARTSVVERLGLTNRPFVTALASLQSHKNIDVLLDAFRLPELEGVRLVLVGATTQQEVEASGRRVPASTVFAGPLEDAELKGLMARSVAFATPSLTEGFGLPPLEAMVCGCPAVVADAGALPEVCADAALYADPRSASDWATTLGRLVENEELRAEMVRLGTARQALFTWRAAGERLISIVRELADST